MPLSILSNVSSLRAQRVLGNATRQTALSFERLSSGLRINRASDDAAGLAISEDLNVKSRIAATASRNISDGVSLLQIAGGALDSISNLVTRMSELAEQAANGTLGNEQRAALQQEYVALNREIARISESTEFNGIKLFEGEKVANSAVVVGALGIVKAISGDGRYVFTNNSVVPPDLIMLDTETGDQTTVVVGGNYAPSGVDAVAVDSSGLRIVFESGDELYLLDRTTGDVTQLTDAASAGTTELYTGLAISADGNTVAFTSQAQYDSGGSVSGSGGHQIVTIDLSTGTYGSVSGTITGALAAGALKLSANGDYLTVQSRDDLVGSNPDAGVEIFFADIRTGSGIFEQITDAGAGAAYTGGVVSNDGQVYFATTESVTDLDAGGNHALYQYNSVTDKYETLLTLSGANRFASLQSSADGQTLLFITSEDLVGENATGSRQLFRYDIDLDTVTQITNYQTSQLKIASFISADGSIVADNGGVFDIQYFDTKQTNSSIAIDTGDGAVGVIQTELGALRSALVGFGAFSITSAFEARQTLDVLEQNRAQLAGIQGTIGAGLSRLETAHSVLGQRNLELDSAKSRIVDVDVADEAAQLTRNSILQQAGVAVLSQANAQTELALLLLNEN